MTNTSNATSAPLYAISKVLLGTAKTIDAAKGKESGAMASAVIAISEGGLLDQEVSFDVLDRSGNVIEHITATARDFDKQFRNEDGTESRATQSAYKSAMLLAHCGVVDDKESNAHKALWLSIRTVYAIARAIADESLSVALDKGKLAVTGNTDTPRAKALRETSTVTGLAKAAKGIVTKGPDNKAKPAAKAAPVNNVVDIDVALRAVAAYSRACANSKEAPSNVRLSFLKTIVEQASKAIAEIEAE